MDCSKGGNLPVIPICGGEATITMLASELGDCKCATDNPDSLVLQLNYKGKKALFVGDIEGKAIETIAQCNIDSDVLRLSHRGSTSDHANYNEFLRAISPVVAFSSNTGYLNLY